MAMGHKSLFRQSVQSTHGSRMSLSNQLEDGMASLVRIYIDSAWTHFAVEQPAEDGQAMIEYGMLVGLLSVVSIVVLTLIGSELAHVFHTAFAAM
jgi:Flp pilus assembly pilin Flp